MHLSMETTMGTRGGGQSRNVLLEEVVRSLPTPNPERDAKIGWNGLLWYRRAGWRTGLLQRLGILEKASSRIASAAHRLVTG